MDGEDEGKTPSKRGGKGRGRGRGRGAKRGTRKSSTGRGAKQAAKQRQPIIDSDDDQDLVDNNLENQEQKREPQPLSLPQSLNPTKFLEDEIESNIGASLAAFVSSATSRLNVPLHDNKPLNWNHKVHLIGEKCPNPRIHLCDKCNQPILVYGRMIPCKHVFCYNCAKESETICMKCNERVIRIEKSGLGSVYKCQYENCGRTYLSQRDLQAHIQHRHLKRASGATNAPSVPSTSASLLTSAAAVTSSSSLLGLAHNQSNVRPVSFSGSGNITFQSPIPVVGSTRSNLITVPIQGNVSPITPVGVGVHTTLNTPQGTVVLPAVNQQGAHFTPSGPQPNFGHHPTRLQWPPMSSIPGGSVPFPSPTMHLFGSGRFEGWPLPMQHPSHPHPPHPPFNRPFYQ